MKDENKSNYLDILQIFRGIAALMVVCHHTIGSIKFYHNIEFPFFNYIVIIGKFGVDFFFVLSGFIISYSAYHKYNLPNSIRNYVKNRLIRVYVPYLPIGILMLVLYSVFPQVSNSDRDISVLTSLTLIPDGNPALSVAWTLTFELCFYLLFSISFWSRKSWNYFVIFWFTLIVLFNYTALESLQLFKNPLFRILFSPYNIEFILGFLLASLIINGKRINLNIIFLSLSISTVSFLYCISNKLTFFYFSSHFLFAIATFLIIYLGIVYYPKKIDNLSTMMLIGNASYSIYLIHNPLQMLLIRIYPKINSSIGFTFALLLVLIITSLLGYLYYFLFEKKAIQSIKTIK